MAKETIILADEPDNPVLRFAPNPNGPLTIGHARGVVVNNYLARKYDGKFIIRFDDTDPRTKKPLKEAYGWIIKDCEWLDAKPDESVIASENISSYYDYARELMESGHAYVCTCDREAFRTRKNQMLECPCRPNSPQENMSRWEMMFSEYAEGQAVLKIKTDIRHPDPALRDWTAFRIIDEPHPLTGDKYRVWPLLDFESAIEDHTRGLTHIIRGIDLMDSGLKQKYVYDYLGWEYPRIIHWGRIQIDGAQKFSTSQMNSDILSGKYSGWDDPRLPTLQALKRRGIQPESITELMLGLGLSDSAVHVSMENLYSINRKNIDTKTNRYFFIASPMRLEVEGLPGKTIRLPLHPSFKDRGTREQCLKEGECLYMSRKDSDVKAGEILKLMGLACIRIDSVEDDRVKASYFPQEDRKSKKIQCLQDYVPAKVLKPDGTIDEGYADPQVSRLGEGSIIQFERYGFARLETNPDPLFIYAHN
jgi:glutamyl-tRNA synthetase